MGVWDIREADDGWWEVFSLISKNFIYAKCPNHGQARMIKLMLNGRIQVHAQH